MTPSFFQLRRFGLWLLLILVMIPAVAQAQQNPEGILSGPVELRVMSFNIWLGGELVDFGKVVEAIQLAKADIVGVQEGTGNTARLAKSLGWEHYDEQMQIISRYPLINPPGSDDQFIYVQVRPGQVVAVMNVHLPSDPYGPYEIRDGADLQAVLELERTTRLAAIEPVLARVPELLEANVPVLLTGDFNTPSHHDWTESTAAAREQVKFPVEWPVTVAVEAAGFRDTYRAIYPDPVENPGITWTYGYPHPRLNPDEIVDRIDLVFAAGDVEILNSEIVGEQDGSDVNIGVLPFPSDHRGVVATVRVTPAVPPVFVAPAKRRVTAGEAIVVHYHAPSGETTDRIALVPAGEAAGSASMWLPPYEASFFGSVTFGTGSLAPGRYDAVLVGEGDAELSRAGFWVIGVDALPTISTDKSEYAVGEEIIVTWENAPALRWDWIAVYSVGDADLYNNYWGYFYTKATPAGSGTFNAELLGEEMLPAGEYVIRLLLDDGYQVVTETTFTVK